MELLFEKSRSGSKAYSLPDCDVAEQPPETMIPLRLLRQNPASLPEMSEPEVVRHYTGLSQQNYGVDSGFYPLGSCTMKYNPKINEDLAKLPGFRHVHPLQPVETTQGCLSIMAQLECALAEITGMKRFSMQPAAGAHGELTGLLMIKAWHQRQGQTQRDQILIPDSAHGTNPASAALAGFTTVEIKSDDSGCVDLGALKELLSDRTAGIMLTNPNTLGLFEKNILEIAQLVHQAGGLLYYDGANANAILGKTRPGDMGFDVVHLNLHKTFSTPHGGGGPGSGPVGVTDRLEPFLPVPLIGCDGHGFYWDDNRPLSIGRVKAFHGNYSVLVRALAYIKALGQQSLTEVAESAVLNANYVQSSLKQAYHVAFNRFCMHECVISAQTIKRETGVTALDIAKRLIDFGYHPPTIYFPLIIREAMMIEPTETESKSSLDHFIEIMLRISEEALHQPDVLKRAPEHAAIRRLDEVTASRRPVIRWQENEK